MQDFLIRIVSGVAFLRQRLILHQDTDKTAPKSMKTNNKKFMATYHFRMKN